MKKLIVWTLSVMVMGCATTKKVEEKRPLYEVLLQKNYGGSEFEFYETVTETKEFGMLLNHPDLKGKLKENDIQTASFLLLSMGEKNTGGYSIGVASVEETPTQILVTVEKNSPAPGDPVTLAMTRPHAIVRINSKKEIVIQ